MTRSLNPLLRWLFLVVVVLLLPLRASASITTGAIKGTTIDTEENPVPGVLLTVHSEALIGGAQQRYSDAEGRFAFYELPPGTYELSAEKAGFSKKVMPNLSVDVNRTVSMTVVMELREAGAEIVVEAARPTIDTEQTSKGEVLTNEFLQRVPVGRDYLSAVAAAPGVIGTGNANISGAGSDENTYMLDGVNITDPVTGTFSLNFNFDAIEQLEVLTNALDPEYGEGLGGVINIVTQTGGNTLKFDSSAWYQTGTFSPRIDARYSADGVQLAPTGFDSQYDTYFLDAMISGPIIRDRAWFIVSYQYTRTLISFSGVELPRDYDGHYLLAKLTAQPNAAHRLTLLFQTNPTTIDNLDQSRFTLPEAQPRQAQGGFVVSGQWDWFFSPETFLETKVTMQKSFIEQYGVPCTHNEDLGYHPCKPDELENSLDFSTPGRIGINLAKSSDNYTQYYFDDRYRYNLTSKFNLLQIEAAGMHDFKTGIELDRTVWNQIQGFNGNLMFADLNVVSYAPDTFSNYYWYEVAGPTNMHATGDHIGYFFQDAYKPVKNLTIRYGFRYDHTIQRNDQGDPVVDVGLWGPRIFTAWDPWGDGKTVIRGGYGRVNDTGRLAVAAFNSQANAFGYKMFLGEYFGEYQNLSSDSYFENPGTIDNIVWDKMVAPHADEFMIGGQRELFQDVALGVSFMARFTRDIYDYDETNAIWDEDGYNFIGMSNGAFELIYRLRTPAIARRDYYQTDVSLKKNLADRWQLLATYSYVRSLGTEEESLAGALVNPEQVQYMYGNIYSDQRHQVKASASYDLPFDPWTTELGGMFEYFSGFPYSRYYFGQAMNSYSGSSFSILNQSQGTYARTEGWWQFNILIQQAIPVRKGQLWAIANIDNVFNNQQASSRDASWVYTENRWVIAYRQTPLQILLGARYKF
jgi:hypothetical protein